MDVLRACWVIVCGLGLMVVRGEPSTDADVQQKISQLEQIIEPAGTSAPSTNAPSAQNNGPTPVTVSPSTLANAPSEKELGYFHVLRQDSLRHDYTNALNAAHNLQGASTSDAVQKILSDLMPELQKLRDEQMAAAGAQIKSLVDSTTKVILSSKDPKDFDAVVAQIGQAITQARSSMNGADRQAVYMQLQDMSRYVKEWQTYLTDQAAGNTMQASNDLRSLANMGETFMPVPRSELLARADKVASATPTMVDTQIEIHSFDDIPAAMAKLQAMQRNGGYSMEMGTMMNSLQNLQNAYTAYEDKNYPGALQMLQGFSGAMAWSAPVNEGASPPGSHDTLRHEITALKDTLLLEITQGLLALPDAPAPQRDEHAGDYVLRIAETKKKGADWAGLMQVLTIYQQVSGQFTPQAWLQEDLAGIHAYLVGEKLESAGQYLDAIRSYRQALATLGRYFPADPAAARLKAMEKSYPQLYQQALQEPIGPKTP